MSARLVVASCVEMAAEADIGHYVQHTVNTPHYRDTLVVHGKENKTQRICELPTSSTSPLYLIVHVQTNNPV